MITTEIEQEPKQPSHWYENKAAIILWLIFFFPVGLYGVWKSTEFSQRTKWIVTVCILFLGLIASANDNKKHNGSSQSLESVVTTSPKPTPKVEEQNPISWYELDQIYNIGSKTTEIQKKEAWKQFKGKKVIWSGEVSEVSDGFTGLTLQVKMNRNTFTSDLLINLKRSERDKASKLQQGGYVKFTGHLDDWGTILPITIDDGEILDL